MSYVERQIDFTIKLEEGTFDGANNTVTLTGLRASVELVYAGADAKALMSARIYGLPLSMMNQLTRIGPINAVGEGNTILVAAGNKGSALSTVFIGNIVQAWADMQAQPDAALVIVGLPAADAQVKPAQASSFIGATDVATTMQGFATQMNLTFENHGVKVSLASPYFAGTVITQLQSCARAADINYSIEKGALVIWPKDGFRDGDVPMISPETGMVGYPVYSSMGVSVTTEFIPNVNMGGQVQIKSSLAPATGTWNVFEVIHQLESEKPDGAWFTQISAYPA